MPPRSSSPNMAHIILPISEGPSHTEECIPSCDGQSGPITYRPAVEHRKCRRQEKVGTLCLTQAGLEPAIFGFVDRRLIHWATVPRQACHAKLLVWQLSYVLGMAFLKVMYQFSAHTPPASAASFAPILISAPLLSIGQLLAPS